MRREFGMTEGGADVALFVLRNAAGMEAEIIMFGGAVRSLRVPDREGNFDDVVLGFDSIGEYERHRIFLGALIGRYANRIAGGRFSLDGEEYQLAVNNGENHLHGGERGFDRVVWEVNSVGEDSLELSYSSADMEEGYPGKLDVKVLYSVTADNELRIDYSAAAGRATIAAFTNHSYFNLAGPASDSILDHELMINAGRFTPTGRGSIPTGELRNVEGTPFDFIEPRKIGSRIEDDHEQLEFGRGYDHNWVLNKEGNELSLAASVYEAGTGRVMEVLTTEPGLQFYSGNFLDGSVAGKGGKRYQYRSAFCLEAQHFPDSPNRPEFPSVVLRPGEVYSQSTIYRFSVR